ncbi:TrmH family RNA methyltransferase [Aureimonas ureilytica]|uniref:TrmH family RNA methyltransferase n=1 Tax=Aureimonas ureilytica TaxID=401562 RepID=UPI0003757922|nr:TrmH family RNA methyltransferase [Aureimonas ureilytica]
MRGFASIGLVRPKTRGNVGAVIRAAHCYGAAMVAIEGPRCEVVESTDTQKGYRHLPIIRGEDMRSMVPYGAVPVAVDLVDDAESLFAFQHPAQAFYVFGPEDGTLGRKHLEWCPRRVMIPMRGCSNLAATVNVILYDRAAKANRMERGISYANLEAA